MIGQFVYVIGVTDNPVKIGIATDVSERLCTLQTGCPDKLQIFHSIFSLNAAATVEANCHERLARHHRRGEWFNVSAETAWQTIQDVFAHAERAVEMVLDKSDQMLTRIAAVAPLNRNAPRVLAWYRQSRHDLAQKRAVADVDRAIVREAGIASWTAFRMVFIEGKNIEAMLGLDALARKRAKIALGVAINAMCAERDRAYERHLTLQKNYRIQTLTSRVAGAYAKLNHG